MTDMPAPDLPHDVAELIAAREGEEFEKRLRLGGAPLPATVTGADLLRVVFRELFRDLANEDYHSLSKGYQFSLSPISSMIQRLNARLPGGIADPAFRDQLLEEVRAWAAAKRGLIG